MLSQVSIERPLAGCAILFFLCLLLMSCATTNTSLVTERAKLEAVPTWITTTEGDHILMPFAVEDGHSIDDYWEVLFPPGGRLFRLTFLGHGFALGGAKFTVDGIRTSVAKPVCLLLKTKVDSVAFSFPAMELHKKLTPGTTVPAWFIPATPGVFTMGIGKLDSNGETISARPYCQLIVE